MTKQQTLSLCASVERIVVEQFALDYEMYQSHKKTRKKEYAECRFVVAMMCKKHIKSATLTIIGEMLKLNHASVLLGIKKAAQLSEVDAKYRENIEVSDAKIIEKGIMTMKKPAYFLGFVDSLDFSYRNIHQAIDTLNNAGFYIADLTSVMLNKSELKSIDGVVFLGGVD